jgi:endonuclease-8
VPEGDTIHTMALAIAPSLVGIAITRLWTREHGEVERLVGSTVEGVEAIGKHLVVSIAGTHRLRLHMGMRGRMFRAPPDRIWLAWDSSAIVTTADIGLVWRNARQVELSRVRGRSAAIARLGPDLLATDCDVAAIVARARAVPQQTALHEVLLDQRVAAGIGNVYKSEVPFVVGIDPRTPISAIDDTTLERLYACARDLMQANVGPGRRDTLDVVDPRVAHDPREHYWVYHRSGLPCRRCRTAIVMTRAGRDARSTYWCPTCQRAGLNRDAPGG